MVTVFQICTVFGSVIMILQILMTMLGMDGEAEDIGDVGDDLEMGDEYIDTHNVSTQFFGIISFRSVIAALAFFGIGGLIGDSAGFPTIITLSFAIGMGFVVMVLVGWIMQTMMKLKSDGTVNIKNAIGTVGTVYLTIPAAKSGAGKVTLSIQNRTMEYEAVTQDEESIATGARVEVCDIVDVHTIEVKRENG
ncbi:MAG: hypothetical protein VCD00_15535 [Candidatus Hydrogenedentota bacterium]